MKTKRKITALAMTGIATVAALTCGITATACGGTKIFATPTNLQIADDILTWDEVPNAKSYIVDINGKEYQTQTNSLDILEITNQPATYAFSVYAIGDYEKTFDSDRSEEIEYVVPQPINLEYKKLDDGTCSVYAPDALDSRAEMTGKLIIPEVSPDGYVVTSIEPNGFSECIALTSIYIPDSIDIIGENAFTHCISATRIRLSEYITSIANNTFFQSAIKQIEIPASVTQIGEKAFAYCHGISQINLPEGLETIDMLAFSNCRGLTEVSIPYSVKTINRGAFLGCVGLTEISIPQSVKTIGISAFKNCTGLTEIPIPQSVKKIESQVFSGCPGLTNVTVPEGVTEIESNAFSNCQNLESVSLPSTLETLNFNWVELPRIKNLSVAEGNPYFKSVGNCILTKDGGTLVYGCAGSVIPDCITTIGPWAFYKQTGLKEVVIPDGVTKICEHAFYNCENLRAVFIPSSVETIEAWAFSKCFFVSVTVPDSVTTIRDVAFEHCVIYNPNDVTPKGWCEKFNYEYSVFWNGWYGQNVRGSQIRYDGAYPYVYSIVYQSNYTNSSGVYALSVPYRQGYTFLGWTTEEGSDKPLYGTSQTSFTFKYKHHPKNTFDLETEIENLIKADFEEEIPSGTILYAVWEKND